MSDVQPGMAQLIDELIDEAAARHMQGAEYRPIFERSLAVQAAADAAALHMRLHPELQHQEPIPVGESSDFGPLDEFTPMKFEAERTPDPMLDLQAQTNALLQAVLDELRALRQDARLTPHREAV